MGLVSVLLLSFVALVAAAERHDLGYHEGMPIEEYQKLPMSDLIPIDPDFPSNDFSRQPIWNITWYDCTGKTNGDYDNPRDCTRFIRCRGDQIHDLPCCDCNSEHYDCHDNKYHVFQEVDEWCSPGEVCPDPEPDTTPDTELDTTPEPEPSEGACPDIKVGGYCTPESPVDCKCGDCVPGNGTFEYFWCDIPYNPDDDPSTRVTTGKWRHETCAEDDLWNPSAGESGECWPNWETLPKEHQDAYRARPCWDDHCEEEGDHKGRCTDRGDEPVEGDECLLRGHYCACGECDNRTSTFWHYVCVQEAPKGDPRVQWKGRWVKHDCAAGEYYNPNDGSCTSNWHDLDADTQEDYWENCFEKLCPEGAEGEICDDEAEDAVDSTTSCNPYRDHCNCGRCFPNITFEYFDCIPKRPATPTDIWTGDWKRTECDHGKFYSPQHARCVDNWVDIRPEETKQTYRDDDHCVHAICEEGQESGDECSNRYFTRFGNDPRKPETCPEGRFYDQKTHGCRPCDEVCVPRKDEDGCYYDCVATLHGCELNRH